MKIEKDNILMLIHELNVDKNLTFNRDTNMICCSNAFSERWIKVVEHLKANRLIETGSNCYEFEIGAKGIKIYNQRIYWDDLHYTSEKNAYEELDDCDTICWYFIITSGVETHNENQFVISNVESNKKEPIKQETKSPSHYLLSGGRELYDVFEEAFTKEEVVGAYKFNVLKYVFRYDKKNGINDLEKASVYLNRLIDYERSKLVL